MTRLALVLVAVLAAAPALAGDDYVDNTQHSCAQYYPAALLRNGVGGVSTVRFFVTSEGRTKKIQLSQSSGNNDLDTMAMVCAATWRYQPMMKDGAPTDSLWQAKVVWDPKAQQASAAH